MGTKSSKKIVPQQKARAPLWLWLLIAAGVALIAFVVIDGVSRNSSAPASAPQVSGAPRLAVDKEKIDLGDVKLGQTVNVSFELTNVGDRALQFTARPYIEVKEGCWPPTPTIGAMVLQPGEKATVSMSFMMHGDMGGPHDFRLHLPTNDPSSPDKTLQVLSNWVE